MLPSIVQVLGQMDAVWTGVGGKVVAAAIAILSRDALDDIDWRNTCHNEFLKANMVVKTTAIYIPLRTVQEKQYFVIRDEETKSPRD